MRALDTNVLVHAEIVTSAFHPTARQLLQELAEGPAPWAIPWPCVYEFLRIVTHPCVYHPPMPIAAALADLRAILGSPSLVLLAETSRHPELMASVVEASGVTHLQSLLVRSSGNSRREATPAFRRSTLFL